MLYDADDSFWRDRTIVDKGYTKNYYLSNIKNEVDSFGTQLDRMRNSGETSKGKRREFNMISSY